MIETEIKFRVKNVAALRKKLRTLGAKPSNPPSIAGENVAPRKKCKKSGQRFQRNFVLDTSDFRLRDSGCLLRLRVENNEALLTYKGKSLPSRFKKRKETNLPVGNAEDALEVFSKLGFTPKWIYEKYTEYFHLGKAEITLDKMPGVGYFMEIEAAPKEIEKAAKALGLDLKDGIPKTYEVLFREFRKKGLLRKKDWVF